MKKLFSNLNNLAVRYGVLCLLTVLLVNVAAANNLVQPTFTTTSAVSTASDVKHYYSGSGNSDQKVTPLMYANVSHGDVASTGISDQPAQLPIDATAVSLTNSQLAQLRNAIKTAGTAENSLAYRDAILPDAGLSSETQVTTASLSAVLNTVITNAGTTTLDAKTATNSTVDANHAKQPVAESTAKEDATHYVDDADCEPALTAEHTSLITT